MFVLEREYLVQWGAGGGRGNEGNLTDVLFCFVESQLKSVEEAIDHF